MASFKGREIKTIKDPTENETNKTTVTIKVPEDHLTRNQQIEVLTEVKNIMDLLSKIISVTTKCDRCRPFVRELLK